jgi:hypothetical protein
VVVLTLLLSAGVCRPALAQDSATAEALFNKGVADMEAASFETGCPALAESFRIEPRPGTLCALADCEARWNKVASAVAHYADYLRMVAGLAPDKRKPHAERKRLAEQSIARLKPTVPLLTLVLPKGAPADTLVKRDGKVLGAAALGTPLPVDPGEHVIVTQVPGGPEHANRVSIGLGESKTIEVELGRAPAAAASAAPAPVVAPAPVATPAPQPPAADARTERRYGTAAMVAGGVGAAGVVVGAVAGLLAVGKKSTVSENCAASVCSTAEGKDAGESGRMLADVATVGFGAGVLGLGTGLVLWFAGAPRKEPGSARRFQPVLVTAGRNTTVGMRGEW